MDTKDKVAKAARTAAKAVGSQQAIAKLTGVDKSAVTHWIRGENCSLENYFKLLEIAKKGRTTALIALATLTGASALTFGNASDASASDAPTPAKSTVYYVK